MKGYELHKTGARVNELLERQFIVPTLDTMPTEDTLTWNDGNYVVSFRIGEMCRCLVDNNWMFFRLKDLSNGIALWDNVDSAELPDMSEYYTRDEVDNQIDQKVSNIVFPQDESIKNVTQEEYDILLEQELVSDKTIYVIIDDAEPIALYIGKLLFAQKEDGQKGFPYNFPIIF